MQAYSVNQHLSIEREFILNFEPISNFSQKTISQTSDKKDFG
ncbi:hypothetical protein NIES21_17130 [Anabaenopsis circularis NIES-21]|uniref:Uncharacterized protein n=1 Tax=Anabaenopsis circularis NIES-21 TaxID=1085406 RepID=A0A1Z4GEH4_9CYAN|nr:hypothetical protein NIES21_17130 [Anabaenopsis circularis NIES-21]